MASFLETTHLPPSHLALAGRWKCGEPLCLLQCLTLHNAGTVRIMMKLSATASCRWAGCQWCNRGKLFMLFLMGLFPQRDLVVPPAPFLRAGERTQQLRALAAAFPEDPTSAPSIHMGQFTTAWTPPPGDPGYAGMHSHKFKRPFLAFHWSKWSHMSVSDSITVCVCVCAHVIFRWTTLNLNQAEDVSDFPEKHRLRSRSEAWTRARLCSKDWLDIYNWQLATARLLGVSADSLQGSGTPQVFQGMWREMPERQTAQQIHKQNRAHSEGVFNEICFGRVPSLCSPEMPHDLEKNNFAF